jgi:hypothetical protein
VCKDKVPFSRETIRVTGDVFKNCLACFLQNFPPIQIDEYLSLFNELEEDNT